MAVRFRVVHRYQVIVRFSLDKACQGIRDDMKKELESAGLVKTGTSTWESNELSLKAAASRLANVFQLLASAGDTTNPMCRLDHMWVYIAKARPIKSPS